MATRRNQLVFAWALVAALQGCSSTPRFNDHFGEAVRTNLSAQVMDPAASANVNIAAGMDGAAALGTYQRYQRSFKEVEPGATPSLLGSGGR